MTVPNNRGFVSSARFRRLKAGLHARMRTVAYLTVRAVSGIEMVAYWCD